MRVLLWVALLSTTGCSLLIDVGGDQCIVDADCAGAGGRCDNGVCYAVSGAMCPGPDCDPPSGVPMAGGGGGLTCGGTLCEGLADPVCFEEQCASEHAVKPFMCPMPPPDATATVSVDLHVEEYTMRDGVLPGLKVTACLAMDVLCDDPVASDLDGGMGNDLELAVPNGFTGYLAVESEVTMPFIMHFTRPLTSAVSGRTVRVAGFKTIGALAQVTGAEVDLDKGIIIAEAYDCEGVAVGGVHFDEATGQSLPFYLLNQLPNLEATTTMFDETSGYAVGGFFNVPPGITLLTVTAGVGGPVILTHNALIRSGAMTYVDIRR